MKKLKKTDTSVGDKTIAQEITNGIYFDSIQVCVQYIEDLFALINAGSNRDYFVRSIISYSSGSIKNQIENFKIERENICKSFYFPNYKLENMNEKDDLELYEVLFQSVDRLGEMLKDIICFYKENLFFYNQYKHGLSIALRPFVDYTDEQIEKDKRGNESKFPLVAMDNLNFKNAIKKKDGNYGVLLIPHNSEVISSNIDTLQKENNLLRYVFSSPEVSVENMKHIAYLTKRCMQIFIYNIREVVSKKEKIKLRMPAKNNYEVYEFDIELMDFENN